jgi:hypothetical protein
MGKIRVSKLSGKSPSGKYYRNKYIVVEDFGGSGLKQLSGIAGQSKKEAQAIAQRIRRERKKK